MKKVFKYIGPDATPESPTIATYDDALDIDGENEAIFRSDRGEYVVLRATCDIDYTAEESRCVAIGRYDTLDEAIGALARAGYDVSALRGGA